MTDHRCKESEANRGFASDDAGIAGQRGALPILGVDPRGWLEALVASEEGRLDDADARVLTAGRKRRLKNARCPAVEPIVHISTQRPPGSDLTTT